MPNKDREKERAYQRQYYLDHRDERIAKANLRQKEKKVELNVSRKKRYWEQLGFREQELERFSQFRVDNRERLNAKRRDQYWADIEKSRKRVRDYQDANPDQMRTRIIRRRARLAGATGNHTTQEWIVKKMLFANLCAYCGEAKPLQREHKIPIFRGGSNDISNIVPSCGLCNLRKGFKTDREFLGIPERRVTPLR
jgi:5-methylcytosine-specific restriction endonuclease McrA